VRASTRSATSSLLSPPPCPLLTTMSRLLWDYNVFKVASQGIFDSQSKDMSSDEDPFVLRTSATGSLEFETYIEFEGAKYLRRQSDDVVVDVEFGYPVGKAIGTGDDLTIEFDTPRFIAEHWRQRTGQNIDKFLKTPPRKSGHVFVLGLG
jgi:hypothetical protein